MSGLLHLVQRWGALAGRSPLRPLLAVPNVTAHPSTASVPVTADWDVATEGLNNNKQFFFSLSRNTRTPYTAAEIPTQRCLLYKRVITLAEYNSSRQSVVWSNVNRRGLLDQLNRPISTVYNCAASAAITASGVDPSDSTELFIAVLCRPFVCCCLDSQRRVDVDPRIQNRTTVCPQKQSQLLFTLVACYSSWTLVLTLVFDRRSFPVLRLTCSWRVTTYVGKPPDVG